MSILYTVLAGAALKSSLVLAIAWVAAILMRRASAALRHLMWLAAAVAVIALPLASIWIPALRIPAPRALLAGMATFQVNSADSAAASVPAAAWRGAGARSGPSWRIHWTAAVIDIWAAGTAFALLQMLLGYAAVARMRRSSRRLPDESIELRESQSGTMPMAAGIWKPAVFLPRDAAAWPAERRRAVVLHEMAHIRRGDAAAQLIARLALSLYWWNPLAWIAWREFVKERERAADDLVLSSGLGAAEYAGHLLEVARSMQGGMRLTGAVAMARGSQLEGRLMAILDSNRSRNAAGRRAMWIAAVCAIAAILPLAAVRAQDDPAPQIPADVDAAVRAAQSQQNPALLEKIATAAEDQHKFDIARKTLEAALDIRGEVFGKTSPEYGIGEMKLADLELRQHGLYAAEPLYSQAVDLLANRPEHSMALVKLGEAALARKNLDVAASFFERAQASEPATSGMATMWLANVRARQGRNDDAEALYKTALSLEEPKSIDAEIVMSTYAAFLRKQGRTEEAANLQAQATKLYTSNTARAKAAASSATSSATGPFAIGGGVSAPRVLSKTEPVYSDEARLAGVNGVVILHLVVGVDGLAHDIEVMHSLGLELDDAAIDAVSQWKFAPGTKDGQPVPVLATIEINFRLL